MKNLFVFFLLCLTSSAVLASEGGSALLKATRQGDVEAVSRLLQSGHSPYRGENPRLTPWSLACEMGNIDVVAVYLIHRVDISARLKDGSTCLHEAAAKNRKELVSLLVRLGADLSATDSSGATAFNRAEGRGHFELAQYIKSRGGEIGTPLNHGLVFGLLAAYGVAKGADALWKSTFRSADLGPMGAVSLQFFDYDLHGTYRLRFDPRSGKALDLGSFDQEIYFKDAGDFLTKRYEAELVFDFLSHRSSWQVILYGAGGPDAPIRSFELQTGTCKFERFSIPADLPVKRESCLEN